MLFFDSVQGLFCFFQDRQGHIKIILTVDFDFLCLHSYSITFLFFFFDSEFLRLNFIVGFLFDQNLLSLRVLLLLLELWLLVVDFSLHDSDIFLLLHELLDARLIAELLFVQVVSLLV